MDPDETMTTSTSSSPSALHDTIDADEGFEDDNLYPDDMNHDNDGDHHSQSDRPHTPANDHLNAAAPGELSPPRSQRQSQSEDLHQQPTSRAMANGTATRSSARVAAMQGKSDAEAQGQATAMSDDRDGRGKPGWVWRSKKAQEERQRAWENIVDRDFSLKEFGDVMLQGKAQVSG